MKRAGRIMALWLAVTSGLLLAQALSRQEIEAERYDGVQKSEFANGISSKTVAFWGSVASARFDVVGRWSKVEMPFDLPAAPKRPAGREGIAP